MSYYQNYSTSKCREKINQSPLPTEYEEQCNLVEWLELKGLLFSKTAQETFTRSWGQKMKNQRSGLRKGLPDMFIFIPAEKTIRGFPVLLAIEMKRTKGGATSPEQKVWIDSLQSVSGVEARITKGFDEAKKFIGYWLK